MRYSIYILYITLLIFTTGLAQNAPVTFEPGEFGDNWTWTVFENESNPPLEIVANPDPSGINTSTTVAKFTALDLGMPWAGVESMHGADIGTFDLNVSNAIVNIMVYKTKISDIGIKYVTPSGGAQMELKLANTVVNQWELISIDFSSYIGLGETTGLDQIVIFPDFIDREADDVIYFDNISFGASLGVNENELQSIISYPNPVKTVWNLKTEETITQLKIYNLFGQNVRSLQPNSLEISLNMNGLKSGIYLVHIFSEKGIKIIKLLKE